MSAVIGGRERLGAMTYAQFCTREEIATFKNVKHLSQALATVARQIVAEMVDGSLPSHHKTKQFLETRFGTYRLSVSGNSDNTTELAAHERMGARQVVMGDEGDMIPFFELHGYPDPQDAYSLFQEELRRRMASL